MRVLQTPLLLASLAFSGLLATAAPSSRAAPASAAASAAAAPHFAAAATDSTHVSMCPLTAAELSLVPHSVAAEPIVITFLASYTNIEAVKTLFRKDVATAVNVGTSRICVANVAQASGEPITASIFVLPDFMSEGAGLPSIVRSAVLMQASQSFATSALSTTDTGAYINPDKTDNSVAGQILYSCESTSALEAADFVCPSAPATDDVPTDNESGSGLGWGLAAVSVAVTALSTFAFAWGYSRYEREAEEKQNEKIEIADKARAQ